MIYVERFKSGVLGTNSYIVYKSCGTAIVIDPGFSVEYQLNFIYENQLNVLSVLLTHGHFDHVFGVDKVISKTGAKTYMSSLDLDLLGKMNLFTYVIQKSGPGKVPFIDNDLIDGVVLKFDNIEVLTISTPGHTPGSTSFLIGDNLFTGDLFENFVGVNGLMQGVDLMQLEYSREKIFNLNENITICPGHGSSYKIKDFRFK